ncbi:hypothetical protein GCM10011351_13920 [Paraliobacillus quinghaiensis]|uniref:Uncharacterized protein n=1 Tax=Paraliobacillus quinghaiensis TaxID=470815 RepID=A0A917TPQ1_9BACI|nr:hypothetical protein GCM10011351_13920 [Paraliobacillus quinghaiensis]
MQLTGAFVLIPFIVAIVFKGIGFAAIFFVEIILIVFFIIVLAALIYIFILRFFDGEWLKDYLINYVQIFLSVSILVGYQIIVRSFEFIDLSMSLFTLVHYLISLIPFGVYIYIVVLVISNWVAWKKVFA